jgi:hypothetical protein
MRLVPDARSHDSHVPAPRVRGAGLGSLALEEPALAATDGVVLITHYTAIDSDRPARHPATVVDARQAIPRTPRVAATVGRL